MKFSIYQSSRQGGRKYNQDRVAYSYSKESLLMVVADGMGGHFHGEIAAQITVQLIAEMFQKQATLPSGIRCSSSIRRCMPCTRRSVIIPPRTNCWKVRAPPAWRW
ncbi:MAG: protein phosphatase 2C domain-containing protein [Sulfuricella sp.]